MPRNRRIQTWLAALLVLLQSLWPAVHAYGHAHQADRCTDNRLAACSCGASQRSGSQRRDAAPERVRSVDDVVALPHDCAICDLLRGTREFHGAAPSPALFHIGCVGVATIAGPEAPLGAHVARPSLPRAPPLLLV